MANGFQKTFQGTQDIFLMKLDPTLSGTAELVYGTSYGGGGVTVATNGTLDLGNGVVAVGGFETFCDDGGDRAGRSAGERVPEHEPGRRDRIRRNGLSGGHGYVEHRHGQSVVLDILQEEAAVVTKCMR